MKKILFILSIYSMTLPLLASVCGLKGSINDRIHDCSFFQDSSRGEFLVVSRLSDGKEILMEKKSGLIWSPRIEGKYSQFKGVEVCRTKRTEFAGIKEVNWQLPTADDYSSARKLGLKSAFTRDADKELFWSETPVPFDGFVAYVFYGLNGEIGYHTRNSSLAVRCVGKK